MSLLEVLIALTILSLVLSIAVGALRAPSPALELQGEVADLKRAAAEVRARAVNAQSAAFLGSEGLACEGGSGPLVFFADGTAQGPDLCPTSGSLSLTLRVDPLTGRLSELE